ncbi:MAG: hypothetical protein DCF26_15205, partial [Burkholderiales bacterium]
MVAERGRAKARAVGAQFLGPPGRLRLAGGDTALLAQVQTLHLPDALQACTDGRHPVLRRGRDRAAPDCACPPTRRPVTTK